MPVRRRLLALLAAALVAGVAAPGAPAQTMPSPEELPPVSELPQTEEPAEQPPAEEEPPAPDPEPSGDPNPEARELPNTGSDARMVALLGATVLLTGVGLRLRTAPEHF